MYAHGGNNFLNVFKRIKEIVDAHPNLEELQIIFVTDGHDTIDNYNGNRNNYAGEVNTTMQSIGSV